MPHQPTVELFNRALGAAARLLNCPLWSRDSWLPFAVSPILAGWRARLAVVASSRTPFITILATVIVTLLLLSPVPFAGAQSPPSSRHPNALNPQSPPLGGPAVT